MLFLYTGDSRAKEADVDDSREQYPSELPDIDEPEHDSPSILVFVSAISTISTISFRP